MEYEFLNKESKRGILRTKLEQIEAQHYELECMINALNSDNELEADKIVIIDRQIKECETMYNGLMKDYKALDEPVAS